MALKDLRLVDQIIDDNPALTRGAVRWHIFKAHENGLEESGAIIRMGRRIYIDEQKYYDWLKSQSQRVRGREKRARETGGEADGGGVAPARAAD